jgi:PHD/YefM family antitoxin component YafN of YafNO toxin-antitoxin module
LQHCVLLGTIADMTTLRMPVSTASRKGVSGVVRAAEQQRVVLTSHGRAVAVVDSAANLDEDIRRLREASLAVLDAAADLVAGRSVKFSLDDVCARLGMDADQIRSLAEKRAKGAR